MNYVSKNFNNKEEFMKLYQIEFCHRLGTMCVLAATYLFSKQVCFLCRVGRVLQSRFTLSLASNWKMMQRVEMFTSSVCQVPYLDDSFHNSAFTYYSPLHWYTILNMLNCRTYSQKQKLGWCLDERLLCRSAVQGFENKQT